MYKNYTDGFGMPMRLYRKIWLIMRLTTIILLISLIQVSAATKAQQVTLKKENASLKSLFAEIKKQTGYMVLYPSALINKAKPVSVDLNNTPLKDALDKILTGQGLEFEIQDKAIVIREMEEKMDVRSKSVAIFMDIKGKVVDSLGNGLPGATVGIKKGTLSTITDATGDFTLKRVDENSLLVASYVGYVTKEQTVNKDFNYIVLQQSSSKLDEVQVLAYGTTTRRLNVGNVSTIKAKDIEKQPVSNVLQALQGRVPGMVITPENGNPAGSFKVRVQGQISLAQGSEPLIVVDGMVYNSNPLIVDGIRGYQMANLNAINPDDIESIDVLKDASATSIYGSRAAAGAILITTKKGKAGRSTIDVNFQQGMSRYPNAMRLMNSQEYLAARLQAIKNDGSSPTALDYDVNGVWDQSRYTNWQKALLDGTAQYTNINLAVEGGTEATQARFTAGYNRQTLVSPGNFNVQRGSLSANIQNAAIDNKLKSEFSLQYSLSDSHIPEEDLSNYITLAPDAPPLYKSDGSINWQRISTGVGSDSVSTFLANPMAKYYDVVNKQQSHNLISNLTESLNLFPFLTLRTSFGYNFQFSTRNHSEPLSYWPPETVIFRKRNTTNTQAWSNNWRIEPQLDFHQRIANGDLRLLTGLTFQKFQSRGRQLYAEGFDTDEAMNDPAAAQTIRANLFANQNYNYNAFFSKLNYNWLDQYLFEAAFRRDGSSRFGTENRYHDFWSLGGGWVFTKEKFLGLKNDFLSFGKVKASYGTTGNDQIAEYLYLNSMYYSNYGYPYQNAATISAFGPANPYVQWEVTKKLSAGLELGFLKDRILISANYYQNRSSNQLISYPLALTTGFRDIMRNIPATIQNSGFEITANGKIIQKGKLNWDVAINLSSAHNQLISFNQLSESPYANTYVIGQPITAQFVFRYADVDPQTGLYRVYKNNGELTSDPVYLGNPNHDQTKMVDLTPTFYGGVQNTITYKSFNLSFFLQFSRQKTNASSLYSGYPGRVYVGNFLPEIYEQSWKKPGDIARFQRLSSTYTFPGVRNALSAYNQSDANIVDGSYVKLNNISFSYSLPLKWLAKTKINQMQIFCQGQNLFYLWNASPFKDPEVNAIGSLPSLRTLTAGMKLQF